MRSLSPPTQDVEGPVLTRRSAAVALFLMVPAATVGVLAALWVGPGTAWGQGVYAVCKGWMLLLPIVWQLAVERRRLSLSKPRRGGMETMAGWGMAVAMVIIGTYWTVGERWIDPAAPRKFAAGVGLDQPLNFLAFAAGTTFVNALLEEYVWRWFVFRQCERLIAGRNDVGGWHAALAIALAALFFTVHHVVAMRAYFGWNVTLLAAAGVFLGGVIWSLSYQRYRSIWPGYVSHILADAAIFAVGWGLMVKP